jgi:hypothetical protein
LLTGGNATDRVVRIGATVRKPWTAATSSVTHYLAALQRAGVDVPETFGQDERGRLVLEFVPGQLAMDATPLTPEELGRVGGLVRAIHDARATYSPPTDAVWETAIPAPGTDLVCHNDLASWNLVIGERWMFIDWDSAAPSTRLWDLAYAVQAFTLSDPEEEPHRAAANLVGALVPLRPRAVGVDVHHRPRQALERGGGLPQPSPRVVARSAGLTATAFADPSGGQRTLSVGSRAGAAPCGRPPRWCTRARPSRR